MARSLAERLLILLSREPGSPELAADAGDDVGDPLGSLRREFPGLAERIRGKRVLDFGCGTGAQVRALAASGAQAVLGFDTNPATLARARAATPVAGPTSCASFTESLADEHHGAFDVVLSKDGMEHFPDPEAALAEMRAALAPGGCVLISFGPPWYAPYGSHMHFFTRVPWVNLLFSEATVMRVRSRYRDDGAARYEEVESGLNRMSLARFERLLATSGLRAVHVRYRCVRGLDALARVPVLRELVTNQVACEAVPA